MAHETGEGIGLEALNIQGGRALWGELTVQGAKNSVLPLLAATLLGSGKSVIKNCPALTDVTASLDILRHLGCRVETEGDTVTVDAGTLHACEIPEALMRAMRSSVIFLGPLLARLGTAGMCYPGGCELGPRPIDLHLEALRTLGSEVSEGADGLRCAAARLRGNDITLSIPSVGATENAMLAATAADGVTTIQNAAREPEIVQLQDFLQSMGADVRGAGTSVITIHGSGGKPLHGGEVTVMGDRIVAATYLSCVAAAGGEVCLKGVDYCQLSPVSAILAEAGCMVRSARDEIVIQRDPASPLKAVRPVRTAPYPGFPTDAQAPVMASLCTAKGATMFVENMFSSRYRHIDELRKMGADIRTEGRVAVVCGVEKLHAAALEAHDLRGGAALAVAALGAEGESSIYGLRHIRRGYADLARDLTALNAKVYLAEKE